MKAFEIGKIYHTFSVCDSNCMIAIKVISRTAQTITVDEDGVIKKLRINKKYSEHRNSETVFPWGRYSMCPIISA